MLHEQRELYTKLTGEDANNISIGYLGAYLDGYERGKSDMVAMLEEIDLQFDEICFYKNMGEWKTVPEIKAEYKSIIREKINELKAESEET